jgi:hypothetical protein
VFLVSLGLVTRMASGYVKVLDARNEHPFGRRDRWPQDFLQDRTSIFNIDRRIRAKDALSLDLMAVLLAILA